jgi:phosphoribosylaminoimidazole-succinocarboxamide synthase
MAVDRLDGPVVTDLDLGDQHPAHRGKVREMFDLGDRFLMVATDRISAFDYILPTGIPGKGKVLTALSVYWFQALEDVLHHHCISSSVNDFPDAFHPYREVLEGRSLLVRKADRFDVECVVRGYITGSGWKDYQRSGAVCGIPLARGLQESEQLPEPIFTPATKADDGHDENISFDVMVDIVGGDWAERLRDLSIRIYKNLAAYCAERGIIVADTKFEFGRIGDDIILIDEVLTPDSSRFWPADKYAPGRGQESFDKQFVRDWLVRSGWDKQPPAPELPDEVVSATAARYWEAVDRLVDRDNPLRFTPETWK